MSIMQTPSGKWRVQIRRKGRPTIDETVATRKQAEEIQARALGRLSEQALGLTVRDAWERYKVSREFRDKADRTRDTEAGRMIHVLAGLGDYALAALVENAGIIADWLDKRSTTISRRTGRTPSDTSLRLELAALAALGAWCVKRRLLIKNPVQGISRPGLQKRKRRVPAPETAAIAQAAGQKDDLRLAEAARFALLCREIGCRDGELAKLQRADLSLSRREALFRSTKDPRQKGGRDRMVHLTEEAINMLNAQLRYAKEAFPTSAFVFTTASRDRKSFHALDYCGVSKRLKASGVVAEDFHLHALRREFISRAIEAGMPYSVIRKQTGHRSTQAIEVYDEGLSTAPDVRAALDAHSATVSRELSTAYLARSLGLSEAVITSLIAQAQGKQTSPVTEVLETGEIRPVVKRCKTGS